jgi:hypothetical protein
MAIKEQGNTIFTNGDQISIGGTASAVTETLYHTTPFVKGYDLQFTAYGRREIGDGVFTADTVWQGPMYGFNDDGMTNNSTYVSQVDRDWLGTGAFILNVGWSSVTNFGSMSDRTYTYYFPATTNFKINGLMWGKNTSTGTFINDQNILMFSLDSSTTTGGNPIPNDRDRFYAIRITPPSGASGTQTTTWFRHQSEHSGSNGNDTTVWWWHPTDTQMDYLGTANTNLSGYTLEVIKDEKEYFDGLAKQFGTRISTNTESPAADTKFQADYRRLRTPTSPLDKFDRVINDFGSMNSDVLHALNSTTDEARLSDYYGATSFKRGDRDKTPVFEIASSTSSVTDQEANWTRVTGMDYDADSIITTPSYTTAQATIHINIYLNAADDSTDGTGGGNIKVYSTMSEKTNSGTDFYGSSPGQGSSYPIFTLKTAFDDHTEYYYKIEWSGSGGGSTGYNNTFSQIKYITGHSSGALVTNDYTAGDWIRFEDVNTGNGHGRWYMTTGVTLNQSAQNTTGSSALYIEDPVVKIKAVSTYHGTKEISLNGIYGTSYNKVDEWNVYAARVTS